MISSLKDNGLGLLKGWAFFSTTGDRQATLSSVLSGHPTRGLSQLELVGSQVSLCPANVNVQQTGANTTVTTAQIQTLAGHPPPLLLAACLGVATHGTPAQLLRGNGAWYVSQCSAQHLMPDKTPVNLPSVETAPRLSAIISTRETPSSLWPVLNLSSVLHPVSLSWIPAKFLLPVVPAHSTVQRRLDSGRARQIASASADRVMLAFLRT